MIIKTAENYPINELKRLWKITFKDTDSYIELFFGKVFKPENTFIIEESGLKSMAFVVEHKISNYKCAYICGVATEKNSRGKGYSSLIMNYIKKVLSDRKYDMAFLIPAEKSLFKFYKKFGFVNFSGITTRQLDKGDNYCNDIYATEFDYKKLNKLYTEFFKCPSVERTENDFRNIYDCYKNVRIYENGYIFYYVEEDTLHIIEHTMHDITPYASSIMNDTNTKKAVVTEFNPETNKPFTMVYYFNNIVFSEPVYINLLLN